MKNIFRNIDELVDAIEKEKKEGKTIVLANGCFDIIHVGHIRYLRGAKKEGDVLVVAVNDDASTKALKGAGRPVVPDEERAEIVASIRYVDYCLIFSERTVDDVIKKLKPHVHAKGTDYTEERVPEYETAKSVGCRTVIVGDPKEHASREIIDRIKGE